MKKLAIITSHPIQYNAPLFRLISSRGVVELKVFYTWGQTAEGQVYDPGFQSSFSWDIPLLDGYEKVFAENTASKPGTSHFMGIITPKLIQQIEEYSPDALLVYGWSFQSHLKVLRHFSGKKEIMFRGDSNLLDEPPGFSFKKMLRRFFLTWVYKKINIALYTGESNKQYYLKHKVAASKLFYAPHAVDNHRFAENEETRMNEVKKWRQQLEIPQDAFVFLFAGKFEPKKNPLLLLDSFQAIKKDNVRLLFAGNGVLEDELKQRSKGDKRVIFLGFQNQQQMPLLYRLGDVFVLPSQGPGETWGLSVNEAMACDRPAIMSDRCGCATDIGKLTGGHVFRSNDRNELTRIMMRFVNKEWLYQKGNIQNGIRNFSFEKIAVAIESVI